MNEKSASADMITTGYQFDDGGRAAAGFKGMCGDCGTRAAAIALSLPYREVYDELNSIRKELLSKARSARVKKFLNNSVRNWTSMRVMQEFFHRHGWTWVSTMKIGSGCSVHLNSWELPSGSIVVRLSKHYTAMVNGVIHDTFDPRLESEWSIDAGNGDKITTKRCVYGYWRKV